MLLFIQGFHSIWAQTPFPEEVSLFREGELLYAKGDFQKALWRFNQINQKYPNSYFSGEAKFRIALCYTQLKQPKEAIRVLNELIPTLPSPDRLIQIFTLLGDNSLELKDRIQALYWYGKGLFLSGQPHEALKKKIRALIDATDTEEELIRIEKTFRGAYSGGYALLRLAKMEKNRGNDRRAQKILLEMGKEYQSMDYWVQAKEVSEEIPFKTRSTYSIGVLLPLSGPSKSFGERAWQAIQLAFKEKPQREGIFSLILKDSKGDPREAEKALEDLVKEEKVIAILGPLMSITTERIAKKAQQLKVTLITFSQKEIFIDKNDFVFQNSITPSEQVQSLVSFAIKDLELRTFGIFYPHSPFGLYFKNLFTQEVIRLGGKVLGVMVYNEDQTDFQQEIKSFFKIQRIQKKEEKKEGALNQRFFVDGLFIPDTHYRVGTILAQMAYSEIKGMTFLGINTWNGPGLLSIGGKGAEGAFFVDSFSKEDPKVKPFVESFQKEYLRKPETLEAICYDGAKLLCEILKSKSLFSGEDLKEELHRFLNFMGVSGLKGFQENGKSIRKLTIYRVKNGKIEPFSSE
ncbi:MAG: penicillin-binding protein activator [Thermodesulfobacteriota bacterium]